MLSAQSFQLVFVNIRLCERVVLCGNGSALLFNVRAFSEPRLQSTSSANDLIEGGHTLTKDEKMTVRRIRLGNNVQ